LNIPVLSDPALAPQIEAIALKIAGPAAEAEALEIARRIAEAQIDVNRVRDIRRRLITGWMTDPGYHAPIRQQLPLVKTVNRAEQICGAPFDTDETLYRSSVSVTRMGRFPNRRVSDSRWRAREVRHANSTSG
jgi:hypothetical protein